MQIASGPARAGGRRPEPAARPAARLAALAVAAFVAAAALWVVFLRTATGQRLDDHFGGGSPFRSGLGAGDDLSVITVWSFAGALAVVVAIGALRGRLRLGVVAAASAGASVAVVEVLKLHLLRRPDLGWGTYNTFPSGHTAVAMGVALAATAVVGPRWRLPVGVVTGGYAASVAVGVQAAGWHRPSDTAAGALVCVVVSGCALALLARARPSGVVPDWPLRPGAGAVVLLAALSVAVGVGGALTGHPSAAGAALGAGTVVVSVAAWLAVLSRSDLDRPPVRS